MANYNITKTDGTPLTVVDQTINSTFSFDLVGQNYVGFGAAFASNTVKLSENFAGNTAPNKAIRGQLWYETSSPNAPDVAGTLKVWTGTDPSDVGYVAGTHGSALVANYSKWKSVVGSATDMGTVGSPITNVYTDNIYATYGEFESIFVGDNVTNYGVTINETAIMPAPDCTISIGDLSNKFGNIYACDIFANDSLNVGDSSGSFFATIIADTANANTLIPGNSQLINLGHSSATAKRFNSVNVVAANANTLTIGTGSGKGVVGVLEPITTNSVDLGSTSYKYRNVISTEVTTNQITPQTVGVSKVGASGSEFLAMYATTFYGTATQAQYADVAERYESDKPYEPGTVIMLGGSKEITETTGELSTDVFGVISTNPALIMNSEAGNNDTHPPVALAGKIPVKIIGKVSKGDRIVSSILPGIAISVRELKININDLSPFSVIGRALEDKNDDNIDKIMVVVGAK